MGTMILTNEKFEYRGIKPVSVSWHKEELLKDSCVL